MINKESYLACVVESDSWISMTQMELGSTNLLIVA